MPAGVGPVDNPSGTDGVSDVKKSDIPAFKGSGERIPDGGMGFHAEADEAVIEW